MITTKIGSGFNSQHDEKPRKILLVGVGDFGGRYTTTVEVGFDDEVEIESGDVYLAGRKAILDSTGVDPALLLNVEGGQVEEFLADVKLTKSQHPEYFWGQYDITTDKSGS